MHSETLMILLHVTILALTIAMIAMGAMFYRKASVKLDHAGTDRVTAIMGEMQGALLGISRRLDTFEQQIRIDLDMIHKRIEYLEQRDRVRP